MDTTAVSVMRAARLPIVLLLAVLATSAGGALFSIAATDPTPEGASASPTSAIAATEAMCESAADLRLYIGFLRSQSIPEDGMLPVLVGAVASIGEARRLAGLVGDTYRPLVDDLVTSLEDLRTAVRGFRDQGTIGAGIASVGEAVTGIGNAMDALSVTLRAPCPDSAPAAPAASPSPVI